MNLIMGVIGLIIWEFGWVIGYFVISNAFESLIAGIRDAGTGTHAASQLVTQYAIINNAFNLVFAIAIMGGILWFIIWVTKHEYEEQQYMY